MSQSRSKILISACLLGRNVRYDGGNNMQASARLHQLVNEKRAVVLCPEVGGGLPIPRLPAEIPQNVTAAEILDGKAKILNIEREDVSPQYINGACTALKLAQKYNIKVAILKARSPSCGSKQVYDGTFSRKATNGVGITTALLIRNGIKVFNEDYIDEAINAVNDIAKDNVVIL